MFVCYIRSAHGLEIEEYVEKHLGLKWPRCPVSGERTGWRPSGKGLIISKFKQGKLSKEHCPKFAAACQKFAEERKGENNPMFGKEAWNKGLDVTHPTVARVAEARRGTKASDETRAKQREVRARSSKKARHTTPHTPETIEKIRLKTVQQWAAGSFERVTSIHLKVREFLQCLSLKHPWVEEHPIAYYSLDFAFPEAKVGIECQGTYFHIDPRVYPNGPKGAIQRRNFGRDKAKRKACTKLGWTIIEVWETEINNGEFKEQLLSKLLALGLYDILAAKSA